MIPSKFNKFSMTGRALLNPLWTSLNFMLEYNPPHNMRVMFPPKCSLLANLIWCSSNLGVNYHEEKVLGSYSLSGKLRCSASSWLGGQSVAAKTFGSIGMIRCAMMEYSGQTLLTRFIFFSCVIALDLGISQRSPFHIVLQRFQLNFLDCGHGTIDSIPELLSSTDTTCCRFWD